MPCQNANQGAPRADADPFQQDRPSLCPLIQALPVWTTRDRRALDPLSPPSWAGRPAPNPIPTRPRPSAKTDSTGTTNCDTTFVFGAALVRPNRPVGQPLIFIGPQRYRGTPADTLISHQSPFVFFGVHAPLRPSPAPLGREAPQFYPLCGPITGPGAGSP